MNPASDPERQRGILEAPWAFWAMVGAATVVAAALRLYQLGSPSFWVDEFFTIARSGSDPLHVAQAFGYLPTQLSLWLQGAELDRIGLASVTEWQALGVTERSARLGACWVGIASVPVLALLARPVAGAGAAGAAALLLAITPWHVYWSQMARFYSTQFLFVNVFVLLFARGLQTGRASWLGLSAGAAVLALLSHPTTVFIVGACAGVVGLAWLARAPLPHLATGLKWLAIPLAAFALIVVSRQFPLLVHGEEPAPEPVLAAAPEPDAEAPEKSSWLVEKTEQSWGPSLRTLVLGTLLRIEPVVFVAGLGFAIVALRRRDPFWIFVAAIAFVPVGVLALTPLFAVGPRYYFPCLFAWALLAAMWAVEVERRVAPSAGVLAGASALAVLVAAVGYDAYLYTRDGAGARARWRDAYGYVLAHGEPGDPVYAQASRYQSRYYLGREVEGFPAAADVASLPPGSWVIHRSRGARPPVYADRLEVKARYEIPSKPWSWVVYVMRTPREPGGALGARR